MNDATRKRLEAAGWTVLSIPGEDGVHLSWIGGLAQSEVMELSCYTRTSKANITALRALVKAFEEEGKG